MHHGLRIPENRRVLYIDFNSFFASVEQQDNPSWAGKPVAVVSHHGPSGTVLAASYEAKALGIRTGTKVRDALLACPTLILSYTHPERYKEVHHTFMTILRSIGGNEVYAKSIDEAAFFVPPNWRSLEQVYELAHALKKAFKEQLGERITCSIGIAPNQSLAKLATDLQKPNGLVEITLENTVEVLSRLELTDFAGIAERNAFRLAEHRILTPLDFYNANPSDLRNWFGIWGQYWWWRLHGFEPDLQEAGRYKSLSHQHVLKKWLTTLPAAEPIILKMAERLTHRLRRNHLQCRKVGVYLRLATARPLGAEQHFDAPVDSYPQLLGTIRALLRTFPSQPAGSIRMITIWFDNLNEASSGLQQDLFALRPGQESISVALENIRDRFRYHSVQLGSTYAVAHTVAKEELGFGRIKDI